MAFTAINPIVLNTPSPAGLARKSYVATDGQTWVKGEFCYLNSGAISACTTTTGSAVVFGIFAKDQTTETASSESVWIDVLEVGTKLQMCITNNGSATGASENDAAIGTVYEAYTVSNVAYVDLNATTAGQFKVLDTYTALNEEQAAYQSHTADIEPGWLICQFILASAT